MNFYLQKFAESWKMAQDTASISNRSRIGLFTEFLYCYVRYGCLPRHFFLGGFWNKSLNDRKDILTFRRMVNIMDKVNNPEDIYILENKAEFNRFFSDQIGRDWILSSETSPKGISSFLRQYDKVIVKPFDEMEGHGIYKLELDKIKNLDSEVEALSKKKVMVEEILRQHPKMVFGNTSVNTIRVHTLLDKRGKSHILSCILRAGVGDTVVDNYCSGGVIYPVDVDKGIVDGPGKSRIGDGHIIHPNTSIVMLGYKIPNWDILIEETNKAAERLPNLRLIGWDVAITEKGIALIEGNHNPDYELYEFIGKGKSYKIIKELI